MIRTAGPGHLEDRTVSSACNPYLAFAAYLTAGLDGVRNRIDPGKANLGNNMYSLGLEQIKQKGIKTLPQSLTEALQALKSDVVIQEALGPIYDEFISLKDSEWNEYHKQVSQWEIDRYLTMF